MKHAFALILFAISLNTFGQVSFEKGYFIDTQNKKTECLIKNLDWTRIPNEFEYKLTEISAVETQPTKNIIEFQIYNSSHYYKKFTLQIDKYKDREKENYVNETQFLKVLSEGKANLYEASLIGDTQYFYQKEGHLKQLIYKKYVNENSKILEKNDYQRELYDNLKCDGITVADVRKLKYNQSSLVGFFTKYSKCQNVEPKDFLDNQTKFVFNFKLTAGAYSNDNEVRMRYINREERIKFDSQINPVLGFEAELLLPFNKNKWSVFINPNYQSYKEATKENLTLFVSYTGSLTVKHSYIEFPIGVRHYFYLNNDSKLSAGVAYGLIKKLNKGNSVVFKETGTPLTIPSEDYTTSSVKMSIGYTYKNKYDLRLDYSVAKKISNEIAESNMNGAVALVLGYKIF